jgi:hypothetical protein
MSVVVNAHYQMNQQQGQELGRIINETKCILIDKISHSQTVMKKLVSLEARIENLENEINERKKYRAIAEILTPIVRQIRIVMVNQGIPASYPGRLLRAPYTVVNDRKRSRYDRIRPYFAVIHVIVLRSYISVSVYGAMRLDSTLSKIFFDTMQMEIIIQCLFEFNGN